VSRDAPSRTLLIVGVPTALLSALVVALLCRQAGDVRGAARLATSGRDTAAVVVHHDLLPALSRASGGPSFRITYRFVARSRAYEHDAYVDSARWNVLAEGAGVAVRYVPNDPTISTLRDGERHDGPASVLDPGLAVFGLLAVLGSAITVVGLVRRFRARR
jgi:Protein of unknown function (DUF3592)